MSGKEDGQGSIKAQMDSADSIKADGGSVKDTDGTERSGPLDWCVNGFEWCPGPDAPDTDGEAWGGKCSDCCLWPDLGAFRGRYGWNQAYLKSSGGGRRAV